MRKLFAFVAVAALVVFAASGQVYAQSGNAANKLHVSASTVDVVGPTGATTILSTSMKTSTNSDLVFNVTAECAVTLTDEDLLAPGPSGNFSSFASDSDFAIAVIRVWVEVDGLAVSVGPAVPGAGSDDGKVTFCRRERASATFVTETNTGGPFAFDPDETAYTIQEHLFEANRQANAFNWVARNVGNGVHSIVVKAEILQASFGAFTSSTFGFGANPGFVEGRVGRRTLLVDSALPGKPIP